MEQALANSRHSNYRPRVTRALGRDSRKVVTELLARAGVTVNGKNPWDIRVHDDRLFSRILSHGSLGLGEAYMDGDWDCDALDEFFDRVISAKISDQLRLTLPVAVMIARERLLNRQSLSRSGKCAEVYYNLPAEVFEATFDRRVAGSCGYWKSAATLDEAQDAKLDLICRKIGLREGESVLDIGCGWGSFVGFAAERYGAICHGVTVSAVQVDYIKKRYANAPVYPTHNDYRNYPGPKVDHVVSVEMFEQVGAKNYRTYFERVRSYMKEDGLFLLHTNWENERYPVIEPWQDKYFFPNADLPTIGEVASATEGLFVIEDVHSLGVDYDKTLMAWNAKFQSNRAEIERKYDRRFCRMWEYFFLETAGAFRCRHIGVGQIVLSPNGRRGGYQSIR
jgi:cyclopropane-fatty-acyl-phospholipid synthase